MNEQTMIDARETVVDLKFLPEAERLKLLGVIYGMRLAMGQNSKPTVERAGA